MQSKCVGSSFATEGIFSKTLPKSVWIFQLHSFIYIFKFSDLRKLSIPKEIPDPSVGELWIFSGTAQHWKKLTIIFS